MKLNALVRFNTTPNRINAADLLHTLRFKLMRPPSLRLKMRAKDRLMVSGNPRITKRMYPWRNPIMLASSVHMGLGSRYGPRKDPEDDMIICSFGMLY